MAVGATAGRDELTITPFLKWAGGKRWLVANHCNLFPRSINKYIEPFVGSGAVYFHLRPSKAILADANSDLINTYRAIQQDWISVQRALAVHHRNHSKDYYYKERATQRRSIAQKAAQFIYLNRTCWNGLYRVNLRGEFNVPIGTKTRVLLDTDDFEAISFQLQNADLKVADFADTIAKARSGDFVFVDPPYTVNHNFNGFLKYNDSIFTWEDQVRLRIAVEHAVSRGAKVLITNANHQSVRELYSKLGKHKRLKRSTVIAGDRRARGDTSELAIMVNY